MSDNQNKIPSFDEVMQKDTLNGKIPSFEDIMGVEELPKKKGVFSSVGSSISKKNTNGSNQSGGLSNAGKITGVNAPATEDVLANVKHSPQTEADIKRQQEYDRVMTGGKGVDFSDPVKNFLAPLRERKKEIFDQNIKIESTGQNKINKQFASDQVNNINQIEHDVTQQVFPTRHVARVWLQNNPDTEKNETSAIAKKIVDDDNQATSALLNHPEDIKKAAIQYYSSKDDKLGEQLRIMQRDGSEIPKLLEGDLVHGFLNTRTVQEGKKESAALNQAVRTQEFDFYRDYPELRNKMILGKISKGREDMGMNNWFLNVPGRNSSDVVVAKLLEKGELSKEDVDFYKEFTRPMISRGAADIPTPGLAENALGTTMHSLETLPKAAYELTGLRDLIHSRGDILSSNLQEDLEKTPTPHYKGLLHNLSNATGNILGVVTPIGLESKVLTGTNLLRNANTANSLATGLTFYHDIQKAESEKNPDNPLKAHLSALLQSAVWMKGSQVFGDLSKGVIKSASPEINDILESLKTGEINNATAAKNITKIFSDKALDATGKSLSGSAKIAGYQMLNKTISDVLDGKFNLNETVNTGVETFKDMMMGLPLLEIAKVAGAKNMTADYLEEMATHPESVNPEKLNPEQKKNFDFLLEINKSIQDRSDLTQQQKNRVQLIELQKKILDDKIKSSPSDALVRKETKDRAILDIEEKKEIENLSNTDLVKEFFENELLGKTSLENLSVRDADGKPTNKFDPSKVGEYLKEAAQRLNNLGSDWKPNTSGDSREAAKEAYPDAIAEIATERWKKEIEAAKPLEEGETTSNIEVEKEKAKFPNEDKAPKEESVPVESVDKTKDWEDVGNKSKETKDATHIGRWLLDNATEGDIIKNEDGGYEVTSVKTKKDDTKEILLTPFETLEDGSKEYNHNGVKLISEQSIKNGSDLFEYSYTDKNGDRVIKQTTYEPSQKTTVDETAINEKPVESTQSIPTEEKQPSEAAPIETIKAATEGEKINLTHAGTEEIYKEGDLPLRLETPTKHREQLEQEAEAKLQKGYDFDKVADETLKGDYRFEDTDQLLFERKVADLKAKQKGLDVLSPEFTKLQDQVEKLSRAADVAGTIGGRFLQSRKNSVPVEETIADYLIREKEINQDAPLTDKQKETVQKEYNDIQGAQADFNAKMQALQEENSRLKAEAEIKKQKGSSKKGVKKDYAAERKQIFESIQEKLKKARQDTNVTILPYAKELIAIAPDVAKLVKNLLEQGVDKLSDIVDNIHETLSPEISGITKKDVQDLIAGQYNEKKATRNELAIKAFDLKRQAQLQNKLELLLRGDEPKGEKRKIRRNQEIEDLKKQIKDIDKKEPLTPEEKNINRLEKELSDLRSGKIKEQKDKRAISEKEKELQDQIFEEKKKLGLVKSKEDKPEDKKIPLTPEEKALKSLKSRTQKELEKVEAQLKSSDFSKPEPKEPIKLDKEALELKDKLIKAKQEREIRILKQEYANRSKWEKTKQGALEVLNVPRTIMSSMDFSAPLRQGLWAGTSNPRIAGKAIVEMFKQAVSQKRFDRWFYDLRETPRYQTMEKSGLYVSDPHDPKLSAKEEAFMNNLAEKIPFVGKLVKGSERAYISFLNKMRVDLFNRFADRYEEQGKNVENSPELFKKMADYVNNSTGRGKLGPLEDYAPVFNTLFFSPRLMASRINLLTNPFNPSFYRKVPKEVRIMYAKDLFKFLALGTSVLALAKLNGSQVEDDPRSTDFGKIKSGNTRWDIWGGFQPYVRVAAQLVTGQRKSANTGDVQALDGTGRFGTDRGDVVSGFLRGKLAPVPSMMWDFIKGKTAVGEDVTVAKEAESHLLPLLYSDMKEAIKDKGVSALFTVGVPSIFGVGVNTYQPSSTTPKTITIKDPDTFKERQATKEEYKNYQDKRDKKYQSLLNDYENGNETIYVDVNGKIHISETGASQDEIGTWEEIKPKALTDKQKKELEKKVRAKASNETKKELFGEGQDEEQD